MWRRQYLPLCIAKTGDYRKVSVYARALLCICKIDFNVPRKYVLKSGSPETASDSNMCTMLVACGHFHHVCKITNSNCAKCIKSTFSILQQQVVQLHLVNIIYTPSLSNCKVCQKSVRYKNLYYSGWLVVCCGNHRVCWIVYCNVLLLVTVVNT